MIHIIATIILSALGIIYFFLYRACHKTRIYRINNRVEIYKDGCDTCFTYEIEKNNKPLP